MESLTEEQISSLRELYDNFRVQSKVSLKLETKPADPLPDSGDTHAEDDAAEKTFTAFSPKVDDILSQMVKNSKDYLKVLGMKVSLYYETSKTLLSISNVGKAKELLETGLEMLKEYKEEPITAFLYMRIVNYLSYVLSITGDLNQARSLLETVLAENPKCIPIIYTTEELFSNNIENQSNAKSKLNKIIINNMQMLGWIYGKLGLNELYTDIIHKSLQRELETNEGDPVQWATRCYRLASLFITQNKWKNAIYHLAAAQALLDPLEASETPNNLLFKTQADIGRVWINYGLHLFSCSKKSILEKIWEESDANQNNSMKSDGVNNFEFHAIEFTLPKVPTTEITNLEEANKLFTYCYQWLKRARFFYSLRDYPLQYVNIMLELSELYRFLAFYEKTIDEQYDIQKKRYETLETLASLVKEVRPNCYFSVSVEIIKEIMEVQIEMMNLNLKKLYDPNTENTLTQQEMKRRVFTMIDISAKMNSISTNNKEDVSDVEFDGIVEPDQDDNVTVVDSETDNNFSHLETVPERGESSESGMKVKGTEDEGIEDKKVVDKVKTEEIKSEKEEIVDH